MNNLTGKGIIYFDASYITVQCLQAVILQKNKAY